MSLSGKCVEVRSSLRQISNIFSHAVSRIKKKKDIKVEGNYLGRGRRPVGGRRGWWVNKIKVPYIHL
jgi:hypothetical protein